MKLRSTILLTAIIAVPMAAQTPPTPPAQTTVPATAAPTAPTTVPTPAVVAAPTPRPLSAVAIDPEDYVDRESIRRMTEDAQRMAEEASRMSLEQSRFMTENMKIDAQRIAEAARIDGQRIAADAQFAAQRAISNMNFDMIAPKVMMNTNEFFTPFAKGQQQWQDPADSAYQAAREVFNRQDYSRAASKFAEFIAKYPNSRNVSAAAYWQAFALYRVGTLESLRSSLKVLETNQSRFDYDYSRRSDAPALQARVLRALAERNEPGTDAKLKDLYAKYPSTSCDDEAINIKSQILNSLYQSDPDAATPYIRQYLGTKDACNASLRRSALFLLANRPSADKTPIIVGVAKNDTVRSVRLSAVDLLSRMPDDAAIAALQDLMKDDDQQVQSAAVRALIRSDNPNARAAMRTGVIDRRDASERQRVDAIQSFDRDNSTPEDAAYLRSLYNRPGESERVKDAVISALSRMPSDENMKFLLDIAKNPNESSYLRSNALRRVTSRQNLSTDDLIKLYDATDSRSMRQSLVEALGQRPEAAATNKMLDIVKLSTDPEVRSNAIQILLRKKDPAITAKVLELIK
jgi:HEAT repeat protein